MANTTINKSTFTLVLDGSGFAISDQHVIYAFSDTQPSLGVGHSYPPNSQITGKVGKKLWALSRNYDEAIVYSEVE
ncbi:hypothetical protein PF327_10755 [Sulfurovum sp. XTW-4]|uniref:Uncharacterized protein n=1 Tax=Sulfurovum xiamenensis TaxID=3019066 RepID=A0ABT7QUP8_9BACT|nr:hypothetical protein [Sulfurovum xiamenensis]MDM5264674.1 hypothetical protein [Sulfurovum xiamenensis]